MLKTTYIGEKGEILAKNYLLENNFSILFTNWRYKRSEIDIIAQKNNRVIFVEVKYRKNNHYGNAETFVTANKIKKMKEAASAFIEKYNWEYELRFDIIAIEKDIITHFEDAFY